MDTLIQDLRYGVKQLWKNRGVTVVAIVSLAVGIGANSVIFSLVNSLLLRPRAVANPDQLVELYTGDRNQPYQTCSYPSYLDLRDHNEVLSGLAAYGIRQFKLDDGNQVEQIWGEAVSGNYFDVLGVPAYKGRTILAEEDVAPGQYPVAVVGHALWQRRFNSDPELVGKTITVNKQPLTVIGIAPPQYTGMFRGLAIEIWVPAMMMPHLERTMGERIVTSRGNRWLMLVGRLKPGATMTQARARFDLLTHEMRAAYPEEWRRPQKELFVTVLSESETRVHPQMREIAYAGAVGLFVIVNLVLLIACMNLASMLLARAVVRRNEIAIRLALGARRSRIVRQLLTESVLLSLIAGGAGLLLAVWLIQLVMAFMPALPEGIRVAIDLSLDWRVLVYTFAFASITGVLFGLAPALHSSKAEVATVLKDDSSLATGRYRKSRIRRALVVAQVAFSLLLLIGAGLVWRSLEKARPTRLGFSTDNILVAPLVLDEDDYDEAKSREFYRNLSERVAALPGVQAVGLVDVVPGGILGRSRRSTDIEGYKRQPGESKEIDATVAGPRYFTNLKMPFLQGRDFDERDREGAPCVAIVNEAFAQKYFGGASPLGKHLAKHSGRSTKIEQCEIVGMIRDSHWQSLNQEVRPFFALPLYQIGDAQMTLMVHANGDANSLTASVRQAIRDLDRTIPVNDVQTLPDYFRVALFPFRLIGAVMAACGLMALLLASVGIYGVISYSVAQRTREVGIRLALGAPHGEILKLIVRQGMLLVGYGLGAGLLLAVVLMRVAESALLEAELLFVSTTDTLTFAGVTVLLMFVALVACYVPARRATKIDPLVALRYE
ncbi:MAG: ABC transporter permease [Acidobacteria bacterium]|nr:ABC transporter permease [Acidobacteriota bacterium]